MVLTYATIAIINPKAASDSVVLFLQLAVKILPVLIVVFLLMVLTNHLVSAGFVKRHLKEKSIKKWLFAVIGGILSTGPVYVWYPLLAELKDKGLDYGLIACFLYNRAIKLPILPLAIVYFGWEFVLVLSVTMVIASLVQGLLIRSLMGEQA